MSENVSVRIENETRERWRIMAEETINPVNGKPMNPNQWINWVINLMWDKRIKERG